MKIFRIANIILVILILGQTRAWTQNNGSDKEFMFAKKLYDDKLYSLAGEQFLLFSKKFPNDDKADDALFLSGDAYAKAEDYQHAFDALKELEIKYPNSEFVPQGSFKLAECQAAQGNFEAAAELFKRVAEFYPDSDYAPSALLEAGKAYGKAQKYSLAVTTFLDLTANYPDSPQRLDAHLQVVNLYIDQGKFEEALAETERIFQALGSGLKEPRFYLMRAQIFEKLGQLDAAQNNFQKLITEFKGRPEANRAYYYLGDIYQKRGDYEKALDNYKGYLAGAKDEELKAKTYLKQGDILFFQKNYEAAIASYQKVDMQIYSSLKNETTFKLGRTLLASGNAQRAANELVKLVSTDARGDSSAFVEKGYFVLVDALVALNKIRDALNWAADYKRKFDGSSHLSKMQFKEAEISEKHLKDQTRALRAYDQFIEMFPFAPEVDAAQLALSRCYEHLQQYELAVQEYKNYMDRYYAGDDVDWVTGRIQLISDTIPLGMNEGMQQLSNLFARFAGRENQNGWSLELGKVYFNIKDFRNAVKTLKQGLAQSSDGRSNAAIFYYLGLSYFRLAQRAILEEDEQAAHGLLDSAAVSLSHLIKSYPDFGDLEEAEFLLAKTQMDKATNPEMKQSLLQEFYSRWKLQYPSGRYLDYFIIQLGDMNFEESATNGSANKAVQYYTELQDNFPQSDYFERATFRKIKVLALASKDSTVLNQLNGFIENYPKSQFLPEALFLRAQFENSSNNTPAAIQDLQRIQSDFFYTDFAQKAQLELADIRFQNNEFRSALEIYHKLNDNWNSQGNNSHLDSGLILFKQAKAYENTGSYSKALQNFIEFVHRNPAHEKSFEAKLEIATIAQNLNDLNFAREYLQSILDSGAQAEFKAKAHISLGDILFKEEKYREARTHYLAAIEFADDELKRYPMSQSVRCRYRLKEFGPADSDAKVFEKKYKDSKIEDGQFLLDKANAYLTEKSFEQAEKAFKKVKDDYKGSDLGAQGEFGLGALYLITNHTEDALKILTDIPAKYPESEVTPLTYYNLGDFYFKSQQLENAINAFQHVLAHPKAGDKYPKALLYLAKCYSDARMWDAAIAVTREFVTKFPASEDNFRKKIDLAVYLMNLKEYSRSIAQLQELLPYADKESEAEIQFYIGQCYNEMGNFERAVAEYLKVKYLTRPTKLPWHVTALFEAGRCLLRLDKTEQAKKIFEQIVKEQGPESHFGRFARKQLEELAKPSPDVSVKNPGQ